MLLDLKRIIKEYNITIKNAYHIGAHFGEEYEIFKECGANKIMMFEPLESNFNVLIEKFGNHEDVILQNFALGSGVLTTASMYVETENGGQSSSMLAPKKHLEQYPHIRFNKREDVCVVKLDDFKLDDFNFISIDVQGYEIEVFKGGLKVLKNIDAIISEVNRDDLYENCAKVDNLDNILKHFGFVRKETNWEGGNWGDALYVKN